MLKTHLGRGAAECCCRDFCITWPFAWVGDDGGCRVEWCRLNGVCRAGALARADCAGSACVGGFADLNSRRRRRRRDYVSGTGFRCFGDATSGINGLAASRPPTYVGHRMRYGVPGSCIVSQAVGIFQFLAADLFYAPGLDGRHRPLLPVAVHVQQAQTRRPAWPGKSWKVSWTGMVGVHGSSVLCGCTSLLTPAWLNSASHVRLDAAAGRHQPSWPCGLPGGDEASSATSSSRWSTRFAGCQRTAVVCCPASNARGVLDHHRHVAQCSLPIWPSAGSLKQTRSRPAGTGVGQPNYCSDRGATRLRAAGSRYHQRQHAGRDRPAPGSPSKSSRCSAT